MRFRRCFVRIFGTYVRASFLMREWEGSVPCSANYGTVTQYHGSLSVEPGCEESNDRKVLYVLANSTLSKVIASTE